MGLPNPVSYIDMDFTGDAFLISLRRSDSGVPDVFVLPGKLRDTVGNSASDSKGSPAAPKDGRARDRVLTCCIGDALRCCASNLGDVTDDAGHEEVEVSVRKDGALGVITGEA
jgi:hypothetical protein